MVVLQYPAVLEEDENQTWLVTFPDFEDAVTFGGDAAGSPRSCG